MIINFDGKNEHEQILQDIKKLYDLALLETQKPNNIVVNLVDVTPEQIQELNKKHRGIDKVTDVLSFPMLESFDNFEDECDAFTGMVDIGDIYINPERVKEQAEEYGHSYKREYCFLALHGMLHLLGYDHITADEERQMFALQKTILDKAEIRRD